MTSKIGVKQMYQMQAYEMLSDDEIGTYVSTEPTEEANGQEDDRQ